MAKIKIIGLEQETRMPGWAVKAIMAVELPVYEPAQDLPDIVPGEISLPFNKVHNGIPVLWDDLKSALGAIEQIASLNWTWCFGYYDWEQNPRLVYIHKSNFRVCSA